MPCLPSPNIPCLHICDWYLNSPTTCSSLQTHIECLSSYRNSQHFEQTYETLLLSQQLYETLLLSVFFLCSYPDHTARLFPWWTCHARVPWEIVSTVVVTSAEVAIYCGFWCHFPPVYTSAHFLFQLNRVSQAGSRSLHSTWCYLKHKHHCISFIRNSKMFLLSQQSGGIHRLNYSAYLEPLCSIQQF